MAGSSAAFIAAVLAPILALLIGSVLCLVFKRRRRVPVAHDTEQYQLSLPVLVPSKDSEEGHPGIAITLSPPTAGPDKVDPAKEAILAALEPAIGTGSPRAGNSGAKRQSLVGQPRI